MAFDINMLINPLGNGLLCSHAEAEMVGLGPPPPSPDSPHSRKLYTEINCSGIGTSTKTVSVLVVKLVSPWLVAKPTLVVTFTSSGAWS